MARAPFPKDVSAFDDDKRISYDSHENKYTLLDENDETWEFNEASSRWHQPVSDEQIYQYQQAFGAGRADDPEYSEDSSINKKRKAAPVPENPDSKKPKVSENRAVYVTNLPLDTTLTELDEEFSKYGIIDQGLDGSKRIKMYADDDGEFNGEALVVYFKKESVGLAIRMMDDYWFRPGSPNIRVQEADMSYKKRKDGKEVKAELVRKDRKLNERQRAEMNRKLAEWSDDDEDTLREAFAPKTNKYAKFVIVKHAFTLEQINKNPGDIIEIKEDMRDEAEEFGKVTNVILYDLEPEGIVGIRFSEKEAAKSFAEVCDGRSFDHRKLDVKVAEDRLKFKKSHKDYFSSSSDSDD